MTPKTAADKSARSERLAAEMRKNLAKRKRQQREKCEVDEGAGVDRDGSKDPA